LTDAPRALELAFVRFLAGRPEAATVVTDALGALTAFAPVAPQGLTITLGKPRANGADVDPLTLTNVRLSPSGAVTAFVMDGKGWNVARAPGEGQVVTIKRDGQPLSMAMLDVARVPATEANSWSVPGFVLAKLHGSPRAGVAPGPRIRLVGAGERGYDAVATPAPADDVVVETDLMVDQDVAGLALRAIGTRDGFRGAALVLTPGPKPRVALVLREESGFESFLAAPVEVPSLGTRHVRLAVKGTKIEAKWGDVELSGTLPSAFAKGDVALFARKGAVVEATSFSVKKR
jgi:hypothetical protein